MKVLLPAYWCAMDLANWFLDAKPLSVRAMSFTNRKKREDQAFLEYTTSMGVKR